MVVSESQKEPLTQLPECLQAHIMDFSGIQAAASLAQASRKLKNDVWENSEVWQALLNATESSDTFALVSPSLSASKLRDQYRWNCFGIDAICTWHSLPLDTEHAPILRNARRALRGLLPSDAPKHIDTVVSAVTDLLRWYNAADDVAYQCACDLVETAQNRSDVFTACHIKELVDALEDSASFRTMLVEAMSDLTQIDAFDASPRHGTSLLPDELEAGHMIGNAISARNRFDLAMACASSADMESSVHDAQSDFKFFGFDEVENMYFDSDFFGDEAAWGFDGSQLSSADSNGFEKDEEAISRIFSILQSTPSNVSSSTRSC
jgi:hypothetical protein